MAHIVPKFCDPRQFAQSKTLLAPYQSHGQVLFTCNNIQRYHADNSNETIYNFEKHNRSWYCKIHLEKSNQIQIS